MLVINRLNARILKEPINYVLCDFDRTITPKDSLTSWAFFKDSKEIPRQFFLDEASLYEHYRPIEVDPNIPMDEKKYHMAVWTDTMIRLFPKNGISYSLYKKISSEAIGIKVRKDFPNFIRNMKNMGIKVFIVSAGLYDPIYDCLVRNDCMDENVSLLANKMLVCGDEILGLDGFAIHSCNKDELPLPIKSDEHGILFGDLPGDAIMGKRLNTYNVAFENDGESADLKKYFDMILTGESSFDSVGKVFFKQYKK